MRIQLLSWLFLIPFYSILSNVNTVLVYGQCIEDQRLLLLQLKNSLVFDNSTSIKLIKWDQTTDCCRWSGVECDSDNSGHVIGLDLSSKLISGGINSSSGLFDLQYLQRLNLAYNSFHNAEISTGFGKLTNLTYLNMSNAGFSGQIPIEISYLTRLVTLDISILSFLANLPLKLETPNLRTLVQNMSSLEELYLDGVNVSANGYDWCQALSSSLPNLRELSLKGCNLLGPIDSSLAKLRFLSVIRLDSNILSTPVPEFFANFTNLTVLSISTSGLNGTFPEKIFQVPTLQVIDLSNNEFLEGSLPEFIPRNSSLQTLVLSTTNFSGQLPDSIGNLKRLSRIELMSCNFNGSIPSSLENLTQLVYLDFQLNKFTGPVPSFRLSRNLTEIIFSHNNLKGQIPSYNWEGLQNLENFDLRSNSLNGSIPLSLFYLPSLQKIQLSNNQFDGLFNEFPNVSSQLLDTLDLSGNKLEGPVPKSVFELRGLKLLSLSYNKFNGTVAPSMIQNLKNLSSIDLSFNKLSINMSDNSSALSSLPQVTSLKLASCKLTVFPHLKNQSKLSILDLSNNQIHGEIPSWVWSIGNGSLRQLNLSHNMLVGFEKPLPNFTLLSLSILDLHSNFLQGQIPILTSSATFLDYSNNNFSSIIPDDIGYNITYTYFFSLSNNSLTGIIPNSICNASYLQVLDLSFNKLNGAIPPCLPKMGESLGVLNLRGNKVSGSIPDTFPINCNLQTLDFNENQIHGQVPRTLANCASLEVLNLGNNQIADDFPCWLKNSSNLRVLVLRFNRFQGSIQCSGIMSNLAKLQIVDLASNNFSGNLPPKCFKTWKAMMDDVDTVQSEADHLRFEYLGLSQLYYQDAVTVTIKGLELELVKILTVYTSIDFSNNNFNGSIPNVLGELKSLYVLNLSFNDFMGQIPTSLGNLTQLESLDLSHNKLTGNIPTGLTSLTFLSFLNLSFNQLVGEIPRGSQFNTFDHTSYLGNSGLCGVPLTQKCSNAEGGSPSGTPAYIDTDSTPMSRFNFQFIVTGLGFGVGAGMILGALLFWKRGRKWYDKQVDALALMILSCFGLVYTSYDYEWYEAEETTATELTEFTGHSSDDDDDEVEDNTEEEAFRGRYCVFCSKLDISIKKAIHNHSCTCQISLPISSSFSLSSSSSS